MPNSLRARISKLAYQGKLSKKDAERIREALEKQIPKKPIKDGIDRMCPICGCDVGYVDAMCNVKFKYCTECGQRIDWSEVDE